MAIDQLLRLCIGSQDWYIRDDFNPRLRDELARLIREIFGNPFHLVEFDPRWRTANAVDLARTIYGEKGFDRMPVVADALMDAGCAEESILDHCRAPGPHVRGCWVVDLLLGRS